MPDEKEPIPQFAKRIKQKYPQYKDVDDTELVNKMIEKYPEYRDRVQLEPVKKKDQSIASLGASILQQSVSGSGVPSTSKEIQKPIEYDKLYKRGGNAQLKADRGANQTERINDIAAKIYLGDAKATDVLRLKNEFGEKELFNNIVKEYLPNETTYGWDSDVFGHEDKWAKLENAIRVKNRPQAVAAKQSYLSNLQKELPTISNTYELADFKKDSPGARSGGDETRLSDIKNIDFNDPAQYGDLISQIEAADYVLPKSRKSDDPKFNAVEAKEKLLQKVNNNLFSMVSKMPVGEDIQAAQNQIKQAVDNINIERFRYGAVSDTQLGQEKELNVNHIIQGLNFLKYQNPAKYKNVMRGITQKGKIASDDFKELGMVGQNMANDQTYDASAFTPELIGKETNINYTTDRDRLNEAKLKIGETLKAAGIENVREFSEKQIRTAAKAHPEITEATIRDIITEEKKFGVDAVPKSGAIEAFVRGVKQPIEGIISTGKALVESPAETYLRSKDENIGKKRLPSDKGNIWYDMVEGLGQFVPQVLLTKGIGTPLAGVTSSAARTVPFGALTGAQAANISLYGGTGASVFLQSYGGAYADALEKTGDPATAKWVGTIDGVSTAAWEMMLPDAKIADDIFRGFKQGLSRDLVSLARRGGNPADLARAARPFVQKFVNNTLKVWGKETSEEVGTQITDFITESIFSPKTAKDRNVIQEAVDTAKSAAVATFLPSILGGAGVSMQKDLTVDGLHDAAVNFEDYKSSLDRALINDQIDQNSYDNLVRLLETHRQSIQNAPTQDAKGNKIKGKDLLEYAYQNTVAEYNRQQLAQQEQSNPDRILLEPTEQNIRNAEEIKRKIFNGTSGLTPDQISPTTQDRTDIQEQEQSPEALEPDEYTIDNKNNFWFVRDKNGAIMSVHNTNEEAQNELTRLREQKGKSQQPATNQLTEQETAAIEGFKGKQFPQSVKTWTDIIQDENASTEQKKQALRELSDQLTAPGTEATVGEALGRDADLIYDLGYPATQESESLTELTQPENETEQTNAEVLEPTETSQEEQGDTTVVEEIQTPPAAPTTPEETPITTTGDDMTGITHAQMDETAREFGVETYESDPETVEQWDAEANERIQNNPNAINNLLEKLRKGAMPDAVEQRMMIRYIASLKARIRANPTSDLLREFNRAKNLSNIVGGRLVAKSLRARQANVPVEDSLANFLSDEAASQGLETLRQDDIDEATAEYEKLQELKKEYERGYEAARQEAAMQQAKRGFEEQKNRKDKRKVDKEKNVQDIKDAVEKAREKLKKLRSGESGLSAVPLPGIRELIAIAPEVKKVFQALATEAIQAGKAKFEDVISAVHDYFKDELSITEQDIIDIVAGEHDERKPTRNDIAAELYVLRRMARLKVELEKLKSGVDPKEKSAKAAKDKRIEELEEKIKEERSKLKDQGQIDQDYLNQRASSIEKKIKELEEKIKNKDYSEPIPPIRPRIDRRTRDLQDKLIELKAMIARRRAKAEYDRMSKVRKGWDTLLQTLGIRRMIQTGIDVSMAGRQAVTSTLNPFAYKRTGAAMYDMFSSLWSPKNFRRNLYNLKESDIGREFTEFGGQFSEPEQMELDKREEEFRTNFVHKFLNKDNAASRALNRLWFSERAAAGYLNMLRIEHYKSKKAALEAAGLTPDNAPEAYKAITKWVMNSSGRGNMLKLIEDSKSGRVAANNIFFGARLMASRMNMLNPLYYAKMPKELRIEAIKDMAGFASGLFITGAALSALGGKVNFDPDDPDFMKVRFGEQTYDLTGGMAVYVRTFLRMTKMAYKGVDPNTSAKDTKKYAKFAGSSLFRSLFENKLAPNTAYLYHFFTQRGGGGGDFDPYEILNYYPLWVNDVKTAYKNDGPTSLMTVLIPSIFGFGTQAYPEKKGFDSEQIKDPTFKYFLDKGMELPNVDENRIKELKDADEEKIEEYRKAHAENLEKELKEVLDKGYVYVNEEGSVRVDKEQGFTQKDVGDLTEEEMASVLSNAQRRATIETKEKMFSKKKKNKF
jgi:hypothetical protein